MSDETEPSPDSGAPAGRTAGFSFAGALAGLVVGWLLFDSLLLTLFAGLIGGAVMAGAARAGRR